MRVQAVCMLLWTHAHLRRKPQNVLLKAMVRHASRLPEAYTPQGSTNLLWALHQILPPDVAPFRSSDLPDVQHVFEQHARAVADAVVSTQTLHVLA